MRTTTIKILSLSLVLLTACATGSPASSPSETQSANAAPATNARRNGAKPAKRPQIDLAQTSGVAIAARHVQGGISVRFALRVANPAPETMTLRRVTVQSVGDGAYHVGPYSVPFEVAVIGSQHQDVQFWAPAYTGLSVVGANGPVIVRVVCEFDWQNGTFQEVVTRVVNSRASVTGE